MLIELSSKARTLIAVASRAARALDPRTVRLRDPGPRIGVWIGAAAVGVALVAGAAALAASSSGPDEREPAATPQPAPNKSAEVSESSNAVRDVPDQAAEPVAPHPRFHDPIYIFTEDQVAKVSAYPLADPPGVVVNLDGAPEPTATPESMVGEDRRIRSIRRRVTGKGLRYVIGLEIKLRRIDVVHEGNVVIITPVK
jgi:hypothetical protein